jgi:hypothetical protein
VGTSDGPVRTKTQKFMGHSNVSPRGNSACWLQLTMTSR